MISMAGTGPYYSSTSAQAPVLQRGWPALAHTESEGRVTWPRPRTDLAPAIFFRGLVRAVGGPIVGGCVPPLPRPKSNLTPVVFFRGPVARRGGARPPDGSRGRDGEVRLHAPELGRGRCGGARS